jgi:phosphosulfolactate synthase (CoM biosynthesis protein A)
LGLNRKLALFTSSKTSKLRPAMDALSYVFDDGYASTSVQDVMEVASFYYQVTEMMK